MSLATLFVPLSRLKSVVFFVIIYKVDRFVLVLHSRTIRLHLVCFFVSSLYYRLRGVSLRVSISLCLGLRNMSTTSSWLSLSTIFQTHVRKNPFQTFHVIVNVLV